MKIRKEVLLFLSLILFTILLSNIIVKAQESPPMPNLPIIGDYVNANETQGLPDTFEKFQNTANTLSEEESRNAYLKQEWKKILAENKAIAPFLYYTDKFFFILRSILESYFSAIFFLVLDFYSFTCIIHNFLVHFLLDSSTLHTICK